MNQLETIAQLMKVLEEHRYIYREDEPVKSTVVRLNQILEPYGLGMQEESYFDNYWSIVYTKKTRTVIL